MKKRPVKVSLIGKRKDDFYQIKFPRLKIPINVNQELYEKMLYSNLYHFENDTDKKTKKYST